MAVNLHQLDRIEDFDLAISSLEGFVEELTIEFVASSPLVKLGAEQVRRISAKKRCDPASFQDARERAPRQNGVGKG